MQRYLLFLSPAKYVTRYSYLKVHIHLLRPFRSQGTRLLAKIKKNCSRKQRHRKRSLDKFINNTPLLWILLLANWLWFLSSFRYFSTYTVVATLRVLSYRRVNSCKPCEWERELDVRIRRGNQGDIRILLSLSTSYEITERRICTFCVPVHHFVRITNFGSKRDLLKSDLSRVAIASLRFCFESGDPKSTTDVIASELETKRTVLVELHEIEIKTLAWKRLACYVM
jgi:hypothetical protein